MNLLYLTRFTSLKDENDITMFQDKGYNVSVLNASEHYYCKQLPSRPGFKNIISLYENNKVFLAAIKRNTKKALKRLVKTFGLDKSRGIVNLRQKIEKIHFHRVNSKIRGTILKIIKERNIDVVYSVWSITCFPEIKAIQEAGISVPIILSIETYPFYLTEASEDTNSEDKVMSTIFEKLDGRIHCAKKMYNYFNQHFNLKDHGKDLIMMGYFRDSYFYKDRLSLLSEKDGGPHIIFIGNASFSERTVDDIRAQMHEIADLDVHFHLRQSDTAINRHPYIHTFPPFNEKQIRDGSFSTFMTQFDASIVLYNLDKNYTRFNNSLPIRFLSAIYAGIPIVVPKGYFGACEEIIDKYKIGFSYESLKELKERLNDKQFMGRHRDNCIKAADALTFEKNFYQLDDFIKEVVLESKNSFAQGIN